jgi:glycosyltransferase involved in cell wall biosynthesis
MARVSATNPRAWFAVVGGAVFGVDSEYLDYLERLAAELGLADRVVFTGHLDDVRPAFAAMDIVVQPGEPEPFGLVTVEAMAMSRPVVGFAHGALREIVVDGETGLLVRPQDEILLAQAVADLLGDRRRGLAMGERGRRRVTESFRVQRCAGRLSVILGKTVW